MWNRLIGLVLNCLLAGWPAAAVVPALALAAGAIPAPAVRAAEDDDEEDQDAPPPFANLREMLDALGIDESHRYRLVDGQPLGPEDDETLVKILYRLPRLSLVPLDRWTRDEVPWEQLREQPDAHRLDLYRIAGRVRRVERIELLSEVAERFGFGHYYLVHFQSASPPLPLLVCVRTIPAAWEPAAAEGRLLDQRASVQAAFLKMGVAEGDEPQYVMAARRVAWHPDRLDPDLGLNPGQVLLGSLGMDVGLLDDPQDRRPLAARDRESFYQLLAAAGRADYLDLLRQSEPQYDLAAMLNAPQSQRGRLLTIEGTARRAIRIHVTDPDIRERLGIDHYFEMMVYVPLPAPVLVPGDAETADKVFSTAYPVAVCVRELPEGLSEGPELHHTVRVPAFYFKLWAYRTEFMSAEDPARRQLSPLLVGLAPEVLDPEDLALLGPMGQIVVGGLFVVVLLGIWLALWRYSRTDRQFTRTTLLRQFEPEEGAALEKLKLDDASLEKPPLDGAAASDRTAPPEAARPNDPHAPQA